jgi:hypothetical protein
MIHQGVVIGHEPGSRFDNIRLTPQNLSFNAADAITPGLRDEGLLEIKPITGKDIANRDKAFQHEAMITFTTEQIKPLYWANYVQLARGYVDAQFKAIGGGATSMGWFTFINNPALFGVQATGTTSLGMKIKRTINGKNANCLLTLNSYITSLKSTDELDFLFSSSASALAANSGGTTLGLTAEAYDLGGKVIPILDSCSVQNSGGTALVGKLGMDSELTWESYEGKPDNRNRAFVQGIRCGGKIQVIDLNSSNAQAFLSDFREDMVALKAFDKSGNDYKYTNGAVSGISDYRISEKPGDSWIEFTLSGDIPVNPAGYTDKTYMDLGQTLATEEIYVGKVGYN